MFRKLTTGIAIGFTAAFAYDVFHHLTEEYSLLFVLGLGAAGAVLALVLHGVLHSLLHKSEHAEESTAGTQKKGLGWLVFLPFLFFSVLHSAADGMILALSLENVGLFAGALLAIVAHEVPRQWVGVKTLVAWGMNVASAWVVMIGSTVLAFGAGALFAGNLDTIVNPEYISAMSAGAVVAYVISTLGQDIVKSTRKEMVWSVLTALLAAWLFIVVLLPQLEDTLPH